MTDTEEENEPKRRRHVEEEEGEEVEEKQPEKKLSVRQHVPSNEKTLIASTINVKDIEFLLKACCKMEGIATILIVFDPDGMQAMCSPVDKAGIIHLMYSKEKFTTFNVTKTYAYHVSPKELEEMLKNLKHAEFLDFHVIDEKYAFKGTLRYPKGGTGEFSIMLNTIEDPEDSNSFYHTQLQHLSTIPYELTVNTSTANFIHNCKFLKTKVGSNLIELAVTSNKLVFRSAFVHGESVSKEISQAIGDSVDNNVSVKLRHKYLDVIVACSEHLNEKLYIQFKLNAFEPVHFMFKLDNKDEKSHFSFFVAPAVED